MSSGSPDERHSDPFLAGAYGLKDLRSAMAFYEQWAGDYDDKMEQTLGYIAPRAMAEMLAPHVADLSAIVLDAGCGTGLTSSYLVSLGFGQIDGIDITPNMIERAQERGIYRNLIEADLTEPLDLASSTYDAIISSGTFTLGHVGPEPIPELLRVLKSGGHFGCTIHKDLWEDGGFGQMFADLHDRNEVRTVERVVGEFFTGLGETALYYVFQKR